MTRENLMKNLGRKKWANKFGKFASFATFQQIFPQKKITCAIFRQAIEGSKFDEKFVKFPPHWPRFSFIYFSFKKNSITPLKLCYLGAERHAADTARNDLHSSDPHPLAFEV